jgi:RecB family exonuclease
MYEALRARLSNPPTLLSPFERDAIAQSAAAHAAALVPNISFTLRAGLIAQMLHFYDQLRRQTQSVRRFEELIEDALGGTESADRGIERLLGQTHFLAETFREYERRVQLLGRCDEHLLRERLMTEAALDPLRHVVVTVADWIADPNGLFVADFDLLARIPGLEALDVVCTERVLGSGFHERIHNWWPGLEEVDGGAYAGLATVRPILLMPPNAESLQAWFTYRDREEELLGAARRLKSNDAENISAAVVFKRPLPYLYLAPDAFGAERLSYRTYDALPLATEPTASALDAILDVVETDFSRGALVALLESPHLRFDDTGSTVSRQAIDALNRALAERRYLGDLKRLEAIPRQSIPAEAGPALEAALAAGKELLPLLEPAAASVQIRRIHQFLHAHFNPESGPRFIDRETRARETVLEVLTRIAAAHEAHHDPSWSVDDAAAAIRRWIHEQTFEPDGRDGALQLVDDRAARYGEFDEMTIVGLVEGEWPEPAHHNIFYQLGVLKALGWPSERDRQGAEEARFLDLVSSASKHVALSTFTLDDETLVSRSVQLDEIARAGLMIETTENDGRPTEAVPLVAEDGDEFHGRIGSLASRAWTVSSLDTYLECPFKFFARYVLQLEEEPEDEEIMNPRREGEFVHLVFETFFSEWQSRGHRTIHAANLEQARSLFVEVVDRLLEGFPEAEAGLERTRLLGSAAAAGLGEAVFRMEAERATPVVKRLLERRLRGTFEISTASGSRRVALSGKADRMDLLEDGTFRLIDYKLGWPPDRTRALQLPIYGLCAEQYLEATENRKWRLGEAVYLAFKGPRRVVPLFSSESREDVLAKAQQRLADTVDAIERGEFPPTPDDVWRCETCTFQSVCRKDYVGA